MNLNCSSMMLSSLKTKPLSRDSKFVKPLQLEFQVNGKSRIWELIISHASVYVVVYNETRKKLIFVRQFRPAVFFCKAKKALGITDEQVRHF